MKSKQKNHVCLMGFAAILSLATPLFCTTTALAQRKPPTSTTAKGEAKRTPLWDSTQSPSRMVYLNGVNIGNVRDQELQNVTIRIDEAGNINVIAPQYDVSRETSYHPLLPAELPRFPKSNAQIPGIPEGRYSKEKGFPAPMSANSRGNSLEEERTNSQQTNNLAPAEARSTQTELKTTNNGESAQTTRSKPTTPVAAPKGTLTVPPIATPDLPADVQGESM